MSVRKIGVQERFFRGNMMTIIIGLAGFIGAVAIITGWITPVTDPIIGRPPFASKAELEAAQEIADMKFADAKMTAEQALAKSIILTEALIGLELDRALNRVVAARDRVDRDPMNRDAQMDLLRAESALRAVEDRIRNAEKAQATK